MFYTFGQMTFLRIFHHFFLPLALAWAAIRKHHRWAALNNKHLFLSILKAGKFRIKVTINMVLCKAHFCFVSWLPVKLCQSWAPERDSRAERRRTYRFVYFLWGPILPPIAISIIPTTLPSSSRAFPLQQLNPVCGFHNTCKPSFIICLS